MPSFELRPRSATEIADAAFQLYRSFFIPLITISAIVFAPFIVINLLLTGGDPTIQVTRPGTMIVLYLLSWVFGSVAEAAVIFAVSDSYMNGVVDIGSVMGRTMRRLGTVMIAVFGKGLWVGFGFMIGALIGIVAAIALGGGALLAGAGPGGPGAVVAGVAAVVIAVGVGGGFGLYFFACYFAVPATVVLENLGANAGLRRSKELSKGVRWKVLAALGTAMTVVFVIQLVFTVIGQSLPGPAAVGFLFERSASVLLTPVLAIMATLLYYDARIRNEGLDIELMAHELGGEMPVTPAPPPAS